jgi:hypothetical protein
VGSPSLWWDTIFDIEDDCASEHDDLKAWLFMTIGGEEPDFMISDLYKMTSTLKGRKCPSLELAIHYFNGESPMSVIPAFISRGLKAAFSNSK